jgi:hypothetical protein
MLSQPLFELSVVKHTSKFINIVVSAIRPPIYAIFICAGPSYVVKETAVEILAYLHGPLMYTDMY